jgi:DNA-binding NarL/FixJ family response regulator
MPFSDRLLVAEAGEREPLPTDKKRVRVFAADPHPVVLYGLAHMFASDPDIVFDGFANSFKRLHLALSLRHADVLLVAWSLLETHSGSKEDCLQRSFPRSRILVLHSAEERMNGLRAYECGAHGTVDKTSSTAVLRRAIRRVHSGGLWVEEHTAENLIRTASTHKAQGSKLGVDSLTERERQVIALVCKSMRNKEIAVHLNITETTVWHHLTSVFSKLGVTNRLSLVMLAQERIGELCTSRPQQTAPSFRALDASSMRTLGSRLNCPS